MRKITLTQNAKINFSIDVLGVKDGYHEINSLMAEISLGDIITIKKRFDKKVVLKCKGIKIPCDNKSNNAYKTALRFIEVFGTKGVTITIDKRIPIAGGLGGSSADVVGVLKGMAMLYGVETERLVPLAKEFGSDTVFMLKGGFARAYGRGDNLEMLDVKEKFYLALIADERGVTARDSYKAFDALNEKSIPCTDKAIEYLKNGDKENFYKTIKNDLYKASSTLIDGLEDTKKQLENSSAVKSLMTGSGSTMFGIYKGKQERDKAVKLLQEKFGIARVISAETV